MSDFEIAKNNKDLIKQLIDQVSEKALEECGLLAEKYAIQKAPKDTGYLRNHITHDVVTRNKITKDMIVGTNLEYAVYQEYGTGIYSSVGQGRKTPWIYKDDKGETHYTHGNRPHPFIKPAIADHKETYIKVLQKNLKGN